MFEQSYKFLYDLIKSMYNIKKKFEENDRMGKRIIDIKTFNYFSVYMMFDDFF